MMRSLYHYLLAAMLTAVALAGPLTGPVSDLDHVNNSTYHPTIPELALSHKVYSYNDLMGGPEPFDPYAALAIPATAGSGAEGTYTADIRMSGSSTRQHMGQLSGQRIWQAIHNCLVDICPHERGGIGCYEDMPSAGLKDPTNPRTFKYRNMCQIENVPYQDAKGGYSTDASINIEARVIYRSKKYPGLGEAIYEMAAGVYKAITENEANCYVVSYDNSRRYRFCNVPHNVLVAFPTTGPVTHAWLSVKVTFNGKITAGEFQCSGSKSSVINFWEAAARPDVAKILGLPENEWGTRTSCEDDEGCFDVNTWRNCMWGV